MHYGNRILPDSLTDLFKDAGDEEETKDLPTHDITPTLVSSGAGRVVYAGPRHHTDLSAHDFDPARFGDGAFI